MTLKFDVEIFDPRKDELQKVVKDTQSITADPAKITKDELEVVSTTRKKLMKFRTNIQKAGLAAREEANKYARDVIAYQKELIGIIEPEEERLKQIEIDTKEYALRQVRLEKLPEMKEKLKAIGDNESIDDESLLMMDPTEFDAYYNQRVADKNEADRLEIENARKEVEREQEIEKAKKKERLEAEKEAERKAKQVEADKKIALKKAEQDKKDAIQAEKDRVARKKKEAERKEAEEKAKREANAKYQAFLKENGWTEENKDDFFVNSVDGKIFTLYKKVAVFKK